MKVAQQSQRRTLAPIMFASILLGIGQQSSLSLAQQVKEPLPEVISAADPIYPPIARAARIYGVVHLHLATDGKRVSAITEQTGPAMLLPFAEAYVRTWIFAEHTPTTFDVTLRYNVQEKSECETGTKINPAIPHLPTEVEIIGAPICDSVRFFRNKKILEEQHAYAVELHFILNGSEVENPSEVVVTNHINRNTFHSVPLPVKNGLLFIPEGMVNGSELYFQARIGQDEISISGISQYQLGESWTIKMADKRSNDDSTSYSIPKRWNIRTACVIEFDPLEGDGSVMASSFCRRPVSK
jgi:hypothetical protein